MENTKVWKEYMEIKENISVETSLKNNRMAEHAW